VQDSSHFDTFSQRLLCLKQAVGRRPPRYAPPSPPPMGAEAPSAGEQTAT